MKPHSIPVRGIVKMMVGVFALLLLAGLSVVAQSYHPALAHRTDVTPTQSAGAPTQSAGAPTQTTGTGLLPPILSAPESTPTQTTGTGLLPPILSAPESTPTQTTGTGLLPPILSAPESTPTQTTGTGLLPPILSAPETTPTQTTNADPGSLLPPLSGPSTEGLPGAALP